VTPLWPLLIGLLALAAGVAVLRSFGPRYRVGRLLSSTKSVSIGDAVALARAGDRQRYIRISGRIDAEDEFEDDAHSPLVFRRTRLLLRDGGGWRPLEDRRETVPFEIHEGPDGIAVLDADLEDGLVVLPRESIGTAADVPDRVPASTDPRTPVRLLVQQVSSVEHVIALGVPSLGPDGTPRLVAGLGRPLILTTLETGEAMRVLAGDHARRPLAAAILLAGGLVFVTFGLAWAVADAIL